MHILIVGSATGREYFLSKKIVESPRVKKLYAFLWTEHFVIRNLANCYQVGDITKLEEIERFIKNKQIDYAVVTQGEAIASGVVDFLNDQGIVCIAPSKIFAKFEENKHEALKLISKIDASLLPCSLCIEEVNEKDLKSFLHSLPNNKVVVKHTGRIIHSGVSIHNRKDDNLLAFLKSSLTKSPKLVLQEYINGDEYSLTTYTDGENFIHTPILKNYKKIDNLITSGMGAVAIPARESINKLEILKTYNENIIQALRQKCRKDYVGPIIVEYFVSDSEIKFIEINTRWPNPGSLNHLSLGQFDIIDLFEAISTRKLNSFSPRWKDAYSISAYAVPMEYGNSNVKQGQEIVPFEDSDIIWANIDFKDNKLMLKNSRALGVVLTGENLVVLQTKYNEFFKQFNGPIYWIDNIGQECIEKVLKKYCSIINTAERYIQKAITFAKKLDSGSNEVFKLFTESQIYVLKQYLNLGTHIDSEIKLSQLLEKPTFLRKQIAVDRDITNYQKEFGIYEYQEGDTLFELLEKNQIKDHQIPNIIKQIIQIVEKFAKINCPGYGKMTLPIESNQLDSSWVNFLENYHHETMIRLSKSNNVSKQVHETGIFIQKTIPKILQEENTAPVLIPCDLNTKNILIGKDQQVYLLSGAVMSGDKDYGFVQFLAHLYKTDLGEEMLKQLSPTKEQMLKLHLYCLISNINVMAFLYQYTNVDAIHSSPWGNCSSFDELLFEHTQKILGDELVSATSS